MSESVEYLTKYYDGVPDELVMNVFAIGDDEKTVGKFYPLSVLRESPSTVADWIESQRQKHTFFVPPLCLPGTDKKSGRAAITDLAPVEFIAVDDDARNFENGSQTCYSVNDSGNGLHAHFRLDAAVGKDKAKKLQSQLVADLGGDTGAKGINQPFRIPGTRTKNGGRAKNVRHDGVLFNVANRGGDALIHELEKYLSRSGRELLLECPEDKESESRFSVLKELLLAGADDDLLHEFLERDDLATTPKKTHGKTNNERWREREIANATENLGGWMHDMNQKYAVTSLEGVAVTVVHKDDDSVNFVPLRAPKGIFENELVRRGNECINKFEAWLKHKFRRTYTDVIFDPSKPVGLLPSGAFNIWRGMIAPRPGNVEPFQEFVRDIICDGDADLYTYLVNWLARLVRQPWQRGEVAFVMRGKKGTGKGTFAEIIGSMFKGHYKHLFNQDHLTGRFNDHLRDCVLLFGDEVFYAGDRRHEGILKGLITEPDLCIEQKHLPVIWSPNRMTIMLASNSNWTVPASQDERRYCVANVSDKKMQDHAYFDKVRKVSPSAILAWLLAVDLKGFNHRDVPDTKGLQDQKRESFDVFDKWLIDYLIEGRSLLPDHFDKFEYQPIKMLYDNYERRLMKTRARGESPSDMNEFSKRLHKACPGKFPKRYGRQASWEVGLQMHTANNYQFPTLEEWREYVVAEYLKQPIEWPEIMDDDSAYTIGELKVQAFDLQEKAKYVSGDSVEDITEKREAIETKLAEVRQQIREIQKELDDDSAY